MKHETPMMIWMWFLGTSAVSGSLLLGHFAQISNGSMLKGGVCSSLRDPRGCGLEVQEYTHCGSLNPDLQTFGMTRTP